MEENNHEALREALLHVERLREKERIAREQMETLITGLQILNESRSVAEMFHEILGSLQKVIPFDCAAILIRSTGNTISTAISTDNRLRFSNVAIPGVFERALAGRGSAITDIGKVVDWPTPESGVNDRSLCSAVLTPLPGLSEPMLVVCASTERAKFKKSELKLLQTFSPLATQAVQRAGEMEELNILVNKLDYYAHYDMLTGLPNRTLFDVRLTEVNDGTDPFSVLFLDLDNFKTVNDSFGHSAGDILLSEIGFRLSSVLGPADTVARMGGDEFAVILRDCHSVQRAYVVCERILRRISEPVFLSKSRIEPGVSIGISLCRGGTDSAQSIMQNADIALYEAKSLGRGRYCLFNLEMKARLDRRSDIEVRLKTALETGEFRLVYQPIYSGRSLRCNTLEALIRWGEDGAIRYRPDEFIPVAESTGDIDAIGLWVLNEAIREWKSWLLDDQLRSIAVNISDVQLRDPELAPLFSAVVEKSNVPASQIKLELSERIVASTIDGIVSDNLEALKNIGFQFSYDDFGTGQSSFMHLQKLPGSTLKIDQSFVNCMADNDEAGNLVAGMIDFAQRLGLNVVAEGVETESQMKRLRALGCDYLQGYYLAKPVPASVCQSILDSETQGEDVKEQRGAG